MIRFFALLWTALLLSAQPAAAHDSQPLLVQIDEQPPDVYRIRTKLPPSMQGHATPVVTIDPKCENLAGTGAGDNGESKATLVKCAGSLAGRTVAVSFPDFNPSLAIVFRYQPLKGPLLTSLQAPDQTTWQVPGKDAANPAPWWDNAERYGRLGVEHILFGFDHLLFVLCLLLLAGSAHRILLAITGFTIAHSITLGLAALGVVRPPATAIEALIALSIVMLATEVARRDTWSIAWRFPMAVSMIFGLLHGFGFASALGEIGLPPNQELLALFAFNVGVEIGQVAFVFVALAILALAGFVLSGWRDGEGRVKARLATPIAYVVGGLASFWLLERISLF